jgi:hypothetical protein
MAGVADGQETQAMFLESGLQLIQTKIWEKVRAGEGQTELFLLSLKKLKPLHLTDQGRKLGRLNGSTERFQFGRVVGWLWLAKRTKPTLNGNSRSGLNGTDNPSGIGRADEDDHHQLYHRITGWFSIAINLL